MPQLAVDSVNRDSVRAELEPSVAPVDICGMIGCLGQRAWTASVYALTTSGRSGDTGVGRPMSSGRA